MVATQSYTNTRWYKALHELYNSGCMLQVAFVFGYPPFMLKNANKLIDSIG